MPFRPPAGVALRAEGEALQISCRRLTDESWLIHPRGSLCSGLDPARLTGARRRLAAPELANTGVAGDDYPVDAVHEQTGVHYAWNRH